MWATSITIYQNRAFRQKAYGMLIFKLDRCPIYSTLGLMGIIKKVIIYTTTSNKKPFIEWQTNLDTASKSIIINRIDKAIETGHFGDCKLIEGAKKLWEMRIHYGPGYRIYFGRAKLAIIVILLGGSKGTQSKDISKAKKYWQSYTKENSWLKENT